MFYDLFSGNDVLADDCANVVPDLSRLLSDDELTEILPEGSPYAEAVTEGGKTSRRRVWDDFGTLTGGHDAGGDQYVMYKLSDSFTMDTLRELLARFVNGLNEAAGFEAYDLVLPDDGTECAQIVYA